MKAHDKKTSEKILTALSEKFPGIISDSAVWSNNFRNH
jgi:Ni,Fe-hydrogenase III component G